MTISAKIILDSINPTGNRITTLLLEYPRFIHSELMTHRVFSRNASSSRAIPIERMIENIKANPAVPVQWGENQPGMQAEKELSDNLKLQAQFIWVDAMESAIYNAEKLCALGVHKQIANRILEPWMHMQTLVTATEWNNFFSLRCHKDAQPEFQELALKIKEAMTLSQSQELDIGEWHIPFVNDNYINIEKALKISTARCARTSYLLHNGKEPSEESDIRLHDRLVGSSPIHASPTEHQAQAMEPKRYKNFIGWKQYRELVEQPIQAELFI